MTVLERLRSGESTLRKPEKVALAHTIVPAELLTDEDVLEQSLEWGCLVETSPGLIATTLLGAWWMVWNGDN
jgi:hypothetical protein